MTRTEDGLARTPLHDLHLELGAKMVPFAGYAMPVHYPTGIVAEHRATREHAGLFDVSHMGQVRVAGRDAAAALETLAPADIVGLGPDRQRYAVLTDDAGGVLDDLMVTNLGDELALVVNAARKVEDLAHLREHLGGRCEVRHLDARALLALQGPAAGRVLERLAPAVAPLTFMRGTACDVCGVGAYVSRSGYTGEDGFEISVPGDAADALARRLLAEPEVTPIGLGARDTLRLEAGLCLYGHDMDTGTTPVEAAIAWSIARVRREGGERAGGFPGAGVILGQLREGAPRRRVGLAPRGRAPVREGAELVDDGEAVVGVVTSGTFGPSVGRPVAMGYVDTELARAGTALRARVRGKLLPIDVVRLPFTEHRYHRGAAATPNRACPGPMNHDRSRPEEAST